MNKHLPVLINAEFTNILSEFWGEKSATPKANPLAKPKGYNQAML